MTDAMNTKNWETAVAYFGPLFLITLFKKGNDSNALWHAKNGAGLFVVSVVAYLIVVVLSYIMPISMLALIDLLAMVVKYGTLAISLYGAWQAWEGKQWNIPFVTNIGQKMPLEQWAHKATNSMNAPAPAVSSSPAAPSEPMHVETPTPAPTPVVETAPAMPVEPMPAPMAMPTAPAEPMTPLVETPAPVEAPMPAPMPEPTPMPEPSMPAPAPTEPTMTTPPAAPTEGPTA